MQTKNRVKIKLVFVIVQVDNNYFLGNSDDEFDVQLY